MLKAYIEAAMRRLACEYLAGDQLYYCEIPELHGVWSASESEEDCRRELSEVIQGWVELGLRHGHRIPVIDGIDLNRGKRSAGIGCNL